MTDLNIEGKIYKRPWGTYQTLKMTETCQVKWIVINPKSKLSLQKHYKRAERWTVIEGTPIITIGEKSQKYSRNDTVFIPKNTLHRLENDTDTIAIVVEVQLGSYLGEDDIVRYDDIYGRTE